MRQWAEEAYIEAEEALRKINLLCLIEGQMHANRVFATDLSKMTFCEINVIKEHRLTRRDREHIDDGNRKHTR